MKQYFINNNRQSNGDYEVHTLGCTHFPKDNYIYLGEFFGCKSAIVEAKRLYPHRDINGCYYCCNECHTK